MLWLALPGYASSIQVGLLGAPAASYNGGRYIYIHELLEACQTSLSAQLQLSDAPVHTLQDDGSGHQEWTIAQVQGGYTISILTGRATCPTFLASATCANGNAVGFAATNDGSGLAVWGFTAVQVAPPGTAQLFQNGIYTIGSTGRAACAQNLNAATCAAGNAVAMDTPTGAGPPRQPFRLGWPIAYTTLLFSHHQLKGQAADDAALMQDSGGSPTCQDPHLLTRTK